MQYFVEIIFLGIFIITCAASAITAFAYCLDKFLGWITEKLTG